MSVDKTFVEYSNQIILRCVEFCKVSGWGGGEVARRTKKRGFHALPVPEMSTLQRTDMLKKAKG